MIKSLAYYTNTLNANIPVKHRALYLRFIDGCSLNADEYFLVLQIILEALTEKPSPFTNVDDLEMAIELYILDNPKGRRPTR